MLSAAQQITTFTPRIAAAILAINLYSVYRFGVGAVYSPLGDLSQNSFVEISFLALVAYLFSIPLQLFTFFVYSLFLGMSFLIGKALKRWKYLRSYIRFDSRRNILVTTIKEVALRTHDGELYRLMEKREQEIKELITDERLRFTVLLLYITLFFFSLPTNENSIFWAISRVSAENGVTLYQIASVLYVFAGVVLRLASLFAFNRIHRVPINAYLSRTTILENWGLIRALEAERLPAFASAQSYYMTGRRKRD